METSYATLDDDKTPQIQQRDTQDDKRVNTTLRYAIYGSILLGIIVASVGFWAASRNQPLYFSLEATRTAENHAKSMTFVWTLIGTILAFSTGTVFNQLLKVSIQQRVAAHGLKIGLIEFWSRLYSRKWLHDQSGRLVLSGFSIIFAIACGLLVSAYTGLITPTKVYLEAPLQASELNLASGAFWEWFQETGNDLLASCGLVKTYGKGANALTLAMCPQVKDPLPYVAAGIASIESKYAIYDPTTSVIGLNYNGTTKGTLPLGWNGLSHFNTFDFADQPPVLNYNYSMLQQGVSANVSCQRLGLASNITWSEQGEFLITTSNGAASEEVFLQTMKIGPNDAAGIEKDSNVLLSGPNFISTFGYGTDGNYVLEFASYGTYRDQWKFPNMTCSMTPYLADVNVTYSNATGLFSAEIVSDSKGLLRIPYSIAGVTDWLFRVTEVVTGSQIIDGLLALQNTPSYESGIFSNVTIDWPSTIELLLQGMVEFQASRLRMILSAELNSTHQGSAAYRPSKGMVASWRLGYNGETAPIATLFPLQGFLLLCAIFVVAMGASTRVKYVSTFDPTNTTHLIVASAHGANRGGLVALKGENAIHADTKTLNLRIEYKEAHGFQEVNNLGDLEYTELQEYSDTRNTSQNTKPSLFARKPFLRTATS